MTPSAADRTAYRICPLCEACCRAHLPAADADRRFATRAQRSRVSDRGRGLGRDDAGGVVSVPHGWGHDLAGAKLSLAAERPGANLNALLGENARDPLSGNAVLSGVAVTLHAA